MLCSSVRVNFRILRKSVDKDKENKGPVKKGSIHLVWELLCMCILRDNVNKKQVRYY